MLALERIFQNGALKCLCLPIKPWSWKMEVSMQFLLQDINSPYSLTCIYVKLYVVFLIEREINMLIARCYEIESPLTR